MVKSKPSYLVQQETHLPQLLLKDQMEEVVGPGTIKGGGGGGALLLEQCVCRNGGGREQEQHLARPPVQAGGGVVELIKVVYSRITRKAGPEVEQVVVELVAIISWTNLCWNS